MIFSLGADGESDSRKPSYDELEALVGEQRELLSRQAAEIGELKRRLGQHSGNSHRPPSSGSRAERLRAVSSRCNSGASLMRWLCHWIEHWVGHRVERRIGHWIKNRIGTGLCFVLSFGGAACAFDEVASNEKADNEVFGALRADEPLNWGLTVATAYQRGLRDSRALDAWQRLEKCHNTIMHSPDSWKNSEKHPCNKLGPPRLQLRWDWLLDESFTDSLYASKNLVTHHDLLGMARKFRAFRFFGALGSEKKKESYQPQLPPQLYVVRSQKKSTDAAEDHPCSQQWVSLAKKQEVWVQRLAKTVPQECTSDANAVKVTMVSDHIVDTQLGGANHVLNGQWLSEPVNRLLGRKVREALADYRAPLGRPPTTASRAGAQSNGSEIRTADEVDGLSGTHTHGSRPTWPQNEKMYCYGMHVCSVEIVGASLSEVKQALIEKGLFGTVQELSDRSLGDRPLGYTPPNEGLH